MRKVDVVALILLPLTFAAFNLYYWVIEAQSDRDYPELK